MLDGRLVTLQIGETWKWVFGAGLTAHFLTVGRLFWWILKRYVKYREDFIKILEEHDMLVEDYNRRMPHRKIPKFDPERSSNKRSMKRSREENE